MKAFSQIAIKKKLEKNKKNPVIDRFMIEHLTRKTVEEVCGLGIRPFLNMFPFENGSIILRITHSVWRCEVLLKKRKILELINKNIGRSVVAELSVKA
jgi:hypothetical protein